MIVVSAVNQRAQLLVALCVLGLGQVRCGGSSGPAPTPGPAPATATPAPVEKPATPAEPTPHLAGVPVYDPATSRTRTVEPPELTGTITPSTLRECDVDDLMVIKALMRKASSAYVEGKYDEAIDLSRRALTRCNNDNYMAHQIIGASSCFKKDARTARLSYARIPPDKKELIEKVCRRAGIILTQ